MRTYRFLLLAFIILVYSCGDGDGLSSNAGGGGTFATSPTNTANPTVPSAVTLAATPSAIAITETSSISATVLNSSGANVPDGTPVTFTASSGTIEGAATTASGIATVTFTASVTAGTVTITGTAGSVSDTVDITVTASAATITLIATPPTVTVNGTSSISATVLDIVGANVPDGTSVTFTAASGTISDMATTAAGIATGTFTANTIPGIVPITGTADIVSDTVNITVLAPATGAIAFDSATPSVIGLRGSGQVETSLIKFIVTDINGDPVVDGISVDFAMSGPSGGRLPAAGGEYIGDINDGTPTTASASTVNGMAAVYLNSGAVAGPVIIVATEILTGMSSASTPISIGGGVPNDDHLSIARKPKNVDGLSCYGCTSEVSIYLADRFGNYNVLEGTSVSFYAESGAIDTSSTVCDTGQTTVTYRTQAPAPEDLVPLDNNIPPALCDPGIPASLAAVFSDMSEWETCLLEYVNNEYGINTAYINKYGNWTFHNPRDGWATIMVTTRGEEAFDDINGNGLFDAGELDVLTQDTSQEAFIDVDDDNTYDDGTGTDPFEIFIDDEISFPYTLGAYDPANGLWDSDKTIFKYTKLLITSKPAYIKFNIGGGFNIPDSNSQQIRILVADINLNYLIGGTSITISKDGGGKIVGNTSYTFPDMFAYGPKEMEITLEDSSPGTVKLETVVITVKVTHKGTAYENSVSGTVN